MLGLCMAGRPHCDELAEFLGQQKDYKTINFDQWQSIGRFHQEVIPRWQSRWPHFRETNEISIYRYIHFDLLYWHHMRFLISDWKSKCLASGWLFRWFLLGKLVLLEYRLFVRSSHLVYWGTTISLTIGLDWHHMNSCYWDIVEAEQERVSIGASAKNCVQVKLDCSDFDEEQAWPLLVDQYVDWRRAGNPWQSNLVYSII